MAFVQLGKVGQITGHGLNFILMEVIEDFELVSSINDF